jgi:hypothetical protein
MSKSGKTEHGLLLFTKMLQGIFGNKKAAMRCFEKKKKIS